MRLAVPLSVAFAMLLATRPSSAKKTTVKTAKAPRVTRHPCHERLDELGVEWRVARPRKGIKLPVEVTGPLGGVTYASWGPRAFVLDCSLVYSLALAGRFLVQAGVTRATYSSAYERRKIRRTNRPSNHSFGLALDVHAFSGPTTGKLELDDDYEQGLGDGADCVGDPLTPGGMVLRLVHCQLERSGLFRIVLSPDYDQDHHNHFHIEVLPWSTRPDREDRTRVERERALRRTTTAPRPLPISSPGGGASASAAHGGSPP